MRLGERSGGESVEMSKMKAIIDARKLGDGGIGVYLENLVSGLLSLKGTGAPIDLTLLLEPRRIVGLRSEEGTDWIYDRLRHWRGAVEFVEEPAGKYSLGEYFGLATRQRSVLDNADIYHSPHYTLPFRLNVPSVITVHDVIHLTNPETVYHRPIARALIRSAIERASHVITVSHASLARLIKALGYSPTPMSVVPNALRDGMGPLPASDVQPILARFGIGQPYGLFVGDDREHKNLPGLLEAWTLVVSRLRAKIVEEPKLVIVSSRIRPETRALIADLGLTDSVVILESVSPLELCALFNGSHIVVVPSFEEGFGLVALEGMACGVPVICSPNSSLKEVCEGCAWYAESPSASALAETILFVLLNPDDCVEKVREGLSRVRSFSTESVAQMTYAVYQDVLFGGKGAHHPPRLDVAAAGFPAGDVSGNSAEHLRRTV